MKPGRELDALVAKNVMGFYLSSDKWVRPPLDALSCVVGSIVELSHYSTDIAAAWELVNEIGLVCLTNGQDGWNCKFGSTRFPKASYVSSQIVQVEATADTAPHAICLAALKAVGVKF